ncbi:MAG: NAD-dependent epimerase/dehydratase family protein [Chthoniobacterales bacterium]
MPSVLIVGCGYLGREVARRFFKLGWNVTAWTSAPESAQREGAAGFRVSPVDIRELDWIRRIGQRDGPYDWVINCVSSGGGDSERYREIYLNGTANLIRGLIFDRLLFTSSTSVYGQTDGTPVSEDSPTAMTTATGQILRDTEDIVLARGGIVARLAGIYGPDRGAMLRRFLEGKSTLDGDGSRWLNTIHRDDAVSALELLITTNADSGLYNVADDGGLTQLAAFQFLAEKLQRPLPPSAPPNLERKRGFSNKQVLNTHLRALGWSPMFPSFLDGLEADLSELVI